MGILNAFFVRKVTDDTISTIRTVFSSADIKIASEFIGVTLDIYAKTPGQTLLDLSSRFETDIMWLSYQSVVDPFEHYHWQAGELRRALVYGCYTQERTWERIEGHPEAWKQAAFFDPDFLALILEDEESDEEKRRLQQIWQTRKLEIGQMAPYVNA